MRGLIVICVLLLVPSSLYGQRDIPITDFWRIVLATTKNATEAKRSLQVSNTVVSGAGTSTNISTVTNIYNITNSFALTNVFVITNEFITLSTNYFTNTFNVTNQYALTNQYAVTNEFAVTNQFYVTNEFAITNNVTNQFAITNEYSITNDVAAGVIVMWSGLLIDVPAGWALCDGTGGTPDLRQSFIKGWTTGIDPGDTGGENMYTPAGTITTPTFTGSALGTHSHGAGTLVPSTHTGTAVAQHSFAPLGTVSQPTFTGDAFTDVINHLHTIVITDPGHSHTQSVNTGTTGGANGYGVDTSTQNSGTSAYKTFTNSTGITAASQNPAGGVASITPSGTISTPTFTGTSTNLTHSVTQPDNHTMSGSSEAVSAGTPAGTISTPLFVGVEANIEPVYYTLAYIIKL